MKQFSARLPLSLIKTFNAQIPSWATSRMSVEAAIRMWTELPKSYRLKILGDDGPPYQDVLRGIVRDVLREEQRKRRK